MEWLHRTNKGSVVYKRKWKPFAPHDVMRIHMRVVNDDEPETVVLLTFQLVNISVEAVASRFGNLEAVSVLEQVIRKSILWLFDYLVSDMADQIKALTTWLRQMAVQLDSFFPVSSSWKTTKEGK